MQFTPLILRILYHGRRLIHFLLRPITIGVRVLLLQEGQVLLVRHSYITGWYLPGGGLKRGETLEKAVRREALEEAGIRMGTLTFLGAYSTLKKTLSDHIMMFLCTDFEQVGPHDSEIAEVGWFPVEALPADVHPDHRHRIETFVSAFRAQRFPVVF